MTDTAATVEIVDVVPAAQKGRADSIMVGDFVFTGFGERVKIVKRKLLRHAVKLTREDGELTYWTPGETVTYVPGRSRARNQIRGVLDSGDPWLTYHVQIHGVGTTSLLGATEDQIRRIAEILAEDEA